MLMTKSRHTSLASLAIYAKPTLDAPPPPPPPHRP